MAFSGGFDEMSRGELLDTADVLAARNTGTRRIRTTHRRTSLRLEIVDYAGDDAA